MAVPTVLQSPAIVNLSFVPGDTLSININLKDSEGEPINISGWTITAAITKDEITIYPFTVTIIDETTGKTNISMSSEDTDKIINKSEWYYKITNVSHETFTYLLGRALTQQI